jgi:dephospho-CoA kinase
MIILGLTGSIGMGKTTTAAMFADEGCPVFDADAAVHTLYSEGGKAVKLVKAVFPEAVQRGKIDRSILGKYMREDPLNLKVLESFVHPWVADMRTSFVEKSKSEGAEIVVFDVPLLFETGGHENVDYVVVVTARPDIQKERVMARPDMTEELFEMLLSRQMADAEKRRRADFILSTDVSLEDTRKQVQSLLCQLKESAINKA